MRNRRQVADFGRKFCKRWKVPTAAGDRENVIVSNTEVQPKCPKCGLNERAEERECAACILPGSQELNDGSIVLNGQRTKRHRKQRSKFLVMIQLLASCSRDSVVNLNGFIELVKQGLGKLQRGILLSQVHSYTRVLNKGFYSGTIARKVPAGSKSRESITAQ